MFIEVIAISVVKGENEQGRLYRANNLATFSRKPIIGSEEFLNRMVDSEDPR